MLEPLVDHESLVEARLTAITEQLQGIPPSDDFEARLRATLAAGVEAPSAWLRSRLGLTETEDQVVWLLIAHELSPTARQALRALTTEAVPDVTHDVLRRVVYGERASLRRWRELGPDGRLFQLSLVERTDGDGKAPEQRQTFRVARRVLALVHGDTSLDYTLQRVARIAPRFVHGDQLMATQEVIERIRTSAESLRDGLLVVHGCEGSGRRSLLLDAAGHQGRRVVEIDGRALARDRAEASHELRLIARDCRLLDLAPLIDNLDALGAVGEIPDRLDLVETELSGLPTVATSSHALARPWHGEVVQIELPPLAASQRAALWQRAIPEADSEDGQLLAAMYPLAPALIEATGIAAQRARGSSSMTPEHVQIGLRSVLDRRLAGLATRVDVTQTWDDLVLPDDQTAALVELLARVRERPRVYETWGFAQKLGRGLGISALFSGPPGTGKTMTAGLIAKDLKTELYQVDLSKIMSKWLGEAEKNLAVLFDAAQSAHAILLFDEADSLFGKRTSVSSSNDRHANQLTNFLLQKIENYTGICILTTNHDTAIDDAFRRRLTVRLQFPVPDENERESLWRAMLPDNAPRSPDIDAKTLAQKYPMSGGYIRNAVLRAAFLAADAGEPIGDYHLGRGAQLEYEAMGKLVT